MMRTHLPILALAALGLSAPAMADVTARYTGSGKYGATMSIAVDAGGQVRAEAGPPNEPRSRVVLIRREGVDYASGADAQGRFVARVDDMIAVAIETIRRAMPQAAREGLRDMVDIRLDIAEGGTETIAGRQGRVYRITPIPPTEAQPAAAQESEAPGAQLTIQPVELVISDDAELAPVGREFARLYDSAATPMVEAVMGTPPAVTRQIRELLGRGTILRIGTDLRLRSVSTAEVADTAFALPGPVLTRAEVRARAPQVPAPTAQE
jgi:hypothetical protein